jgi:ADP-L-glycero-D-manno-heptose 6-epimerase
MSVDQSGLFNLGTGQSKSFLSVALEVTNSIKFIPMPDNLKSSYQRYTCADMTKTRSILRL